MSPDNQPQSSLRNFTLGSDRKPGIAEQDTPHSFDFLAKGVHDYLESIDLIFRNNGSTNETSDLTVELYNKTLQKTVESETQTSVTVQSGSVLKVEFLSADVADTGDESSVTESAIDIIESNEYSVTVTESYSSDVELLQTLVNARGGEYNFYEDQVGDLVVEDQKDIERLRLSPKSNSRILTSDESQPVVFQNQYESQGGKAPILVGVSGIHFGRLNEEEQDGYLAGVTNPKETLRFGPIASFDPGEVYRGRVAVRSTERVIGTRATMTDPDFNVPSGAEFSVHDLTAGTELFSSTQPIIEDFVDYVPPNDAAIEFRVTNTTSSTSMDLGGTVSYDIVDA